MIHFAQLNKGGVLYHTMADVPPDGARWDASPAPTVTLYSTSSGVIRAAESATLGPSTTLGAAAAARATSLTVAATTGISRFDRMVVGPNAAGQWEWVTVDGAAGTTVTLLDPLDYSYEISSVLKSHTMSTTLSSSDAGSTIRRCRADWAYTVDSVARVESTPYVVSRYAPRLAVTAADVIQHEPRAKKLIGSNQQIEILIKSIWETRVLPDIAKLYGSPGSVPSGESLQQALLAKFDAHVARRTGAYEAELRYEEIYQELIDEVRVGMIDTDEDGDVEDETPRTTRVARVMRG